MECIAIASRGSVLELPDVEHEIGRLADLDLEELHRLWFTHYAVSAPRHLSAQVMIGTIAYRLQEQAHGGSVGCCVNGKAAPMK
jgi:hypothetical protein